MPFTRRTLISSVLGASGTAVAQTFAGTGQTTIGFQADMLPERSECGIGALMPWAGALWAVTYNSHRKPTGTGLGLYRIDDVLKSERVPRARRHTRQPADPPRVEPMLHRSLRH